MTQQESAAREVVRQALDTLLPVFKSLPADGGTGTGAGSTGPDDPPGDKDRAGDSAAAPGAARDGPKPITLSAAMQPPAYVRYLRRVLAEDGHMQPTLIHIFGLIVRNQERFYASR